MKNSVVSFRYLLFLVVLFAGCDLEKIEPSGSTGGVKANFSYSVDGCSAPFVVTFHNLTAGAASSQWSFGTAGSSQQKDPVFTFTAPGTYAIRLSTNVSGVGTGDTTVTLNLQNSSRFQIPSYAASTDTRVNTNVLQLPDGGYAVAGFFYNPSIGKKVYLYKANADGTKAFDNMAIGNSPGQYTPTIIRNSIDGDIIVAGVYQGNTSAPFEFFILRVSSAGVLKKEKNFSTAASQYTPTSLVPMADGNFVVLGTKPSLVTGNPEDLVLVHLDSGFNVKKEQTYNSAANEKVNAAMAEGSKTVVAFCTFYSQPVTSHHMLKIELDNYNLIDDKTLNNLDSDLDQIWGATKSKTEESYVVGGATKSGNCYLLKIDKNGTSRLFGVQFEPGAFLWVSGTVDGGFVAGGFGGTSAYYVVKTKANLEQEFQFGTSSLSLSPECDGVEQTTDGGYVSTGRLNLVNGTTPVLFKHDCQLKTN